jgi:hypothetical protein
MPKMLVLAFLFLGYTIVFSFVFSSNYCPGLIPSVGSPVILEIRYTSIGIDISI